MSKKNNIILEKIIKIFFAFIKILLVLMILIPIIKILVELLHDYKESKQVDYSYLEEWTKELYEENPDILTFDSDNKAILKMDDLNEALHNKNRYYTLLMTSDLDECVGYLVAEKQEDGTIKVDTSHICDLVD
jgi:hypothetical protein